MAYYSPDNEYIWQEDYKMLPAKYLNIPGLHMIGYSHRHEVAELLKPHYHHAMEFVVLLKGRQQYIASNHIYPISICCHTGEGAMSIGIMEKRLADI